MTGGKRFLFKNEDIMDLDNCYRPSCVLPNSEEPVFFVPDVFTEKDGHLADLGGE